jgi:hypothetical protein
MRCIWADIELLIDGSHRVGEQSAARDDDEAQVGGSRV